MVLFLKTFAQKVVITLPSGKLTFWVKDCLSAPEAPIDSHTKSTEKG